MFLFLKLLKRADLDSTSYHMVCIKLLSPFIGLSFLDFAAGETARSLARSHCENLISDLWSYRTVFGMRFECWLVYTCHHAVSTLLLHIPLPGPHEETLSRGCELLYDMARYMPRAHSFLVSLRDQFIARDSDIPGACRPFLLLERVEKDHNEAKAHHDVISSCL